MKTPNGLIFICAVALATLGAVADASAQVVEGEEHCVVHVAAWDRLNVRDEPSSGGDVVTLHRYGDCGIVVVGEPDGTWYPIEDGHFGGWVNGKYISMVSPAMYCVSGVEDDDVLNLRAYPSMISRVIRELDPHQCNIAFLPYAVGTWQKVRVDGYEGWASRKFLSGE